MTKTIEEYLRALKQALTGSDSATIQDALADAEEHLRTALASRRESQPDLDEGNALEQIIKQYGTPEETAAAYAEVVTVNSTRYYLPLFTLPQFPLIGIVLWTLMMHLVRWIGGLHGRYAKALLVTE